MWNFFHIKKKSVEKFLNTSEIVSFISKNEGLSMRALEDKVGTSQGVLSKIVKNNGDIKCSLLKRILEIFPHYNSYWLITGKGDPLQANTTDNSLNIIMDRYDKLKDENVILKQKVEGLKQQKKYRNLTKPQIAADPELSIEKPVKNK